MSKLKLPKLKKVGTKTEIKKEGYIPKDQRKTILLLSDDLRTYSGVGCQARNIVLNSAHHFNWVNLGGAVKHPEKGKGFDLSNDASVMLDIADETEPLPDARSLAAANTPDPSRIDKAPTPFTKFILVVLAILCKATSVI